MNNAKFIVLAEVPVLPEHWDAVVALSAATLELTLAEPGCEAFYQTQKKDASDTLVFFEVFQSKEAFEIHMETAYTKAFFAGIQGKLAGRPVSTILQQL